MCGRGLTSKSEVGTGERGEQQLKQHKLRPCGWETQAPWTAVEQMAIVIPWLSQNENPLPMFEEAPSFTGQTSFPSQALKMSKNHTVSLLQLAAGA